MCASMRQGGRFSQADWRYFSQGEKKANRGCAAGDAEGIIRGASNAQ